MNESTTQVRGLGHSLRIYLKDKTLFRYWLTPFAGRVLRRVQYTRQVFSDKLYRARFTTLIPKNEFINDIRTAIECNTGYAAGKIGGSQKYWMYYEILLSKERKLNRIRQFEKDLLFHGLKQVGYFPRRSRFLFKV